MLHRPGPEIERMTPATAHDSLFSDLLNLDIVDAEYDLFSGVLKRWCNVHYVDDLLEKVLKDNHLKLQLVRESCRIDGCSFLEDELFSHSAERLAKELIEGYNCTEKLKASGMRQYQLKPLYNLFFTRDASSSIYDKVLVNSMSFKVRERETLIFKAIAEHCFGAETLNAQAWNPDARTEGGDVQVASDNLLCIGCGIRTNQLGIDYIGETLSRERGRFRILVQELPMEPDSFIHLDMVHTFLGAHSTMDYEPMLRKEAEFAGKETALLTYEDGFLKETKECDNIIKGLKMAGIEVEPVLCGGSDLWNQQREQWHSGANFFALGDGKAIGYRRNRHTIEALDKAGYSILPAEKVCDGSVDMQAYDKFIVDFAASELPRGGGGARCMTMPLARE